VSDDGLRRGGAVTGPGAGAPRGIPFLDLDGTTAGIRDEVVAGWQELLDSNAWVGGRVVEQFEQEWAAYCGTSEAVGVANGTDALHLILRALGIGPGDEVIVPANTFIATAEAVVLAGARPRFVDVDPNTLLLTAESVAAAVTPATAAVMPVHLYGHVVDLPAVSAVADRHGIALIEDAAQAHGSTRDDIRAGSTGRAAGFSFYPGKNLGAFGDAGAVTTNDPDLAATVRSMGAHGRSEKDRYLHPVVGTNSRLDAVQAVVLRAKLRCLDEWNEGRRRVVAAYRERLEGLPLRLVEPDPGVSSSWHLLVARVAERARVQEDLRRAGIGTNIHYPVPCPEQAGYTQWAEGSYPVASRTAKEILSLPLHPHMAVDDVDRVCEALATVLCPEEPAA
jgi:dTDP-4-amino-4,6-dideoxygalactose transaminase